ncbi:hypothetical protein HHK36_030193 [Tetracentron sinense]|uniref:NADP-dependent oxidoreductase domain-containing protein n=1 Tax=Tetracentron sinense TaxID=13715 RepID=A0A834YCQ4_TETSI|nr:hypothetical protein HHK36_030193 [Tetracentron sinense]
MGSLEQFDFELQPIQEIALRWIYEQGVGLIVKSFNKERIKQNFQIFDWGLSEEELAKVNQVPQCRGMSGEMFVSPDGPYKSVEELWDGEL